MDTFKLALDISGAAKGSPPPTSFLDVVPSFIILPTLSYLLATITTHLLHPPLPSHPSHPSPSPKAFSPLILLPPTVTTPIPQVVVEGPRMIFAFGTCVLAAAVGAAYVLAGRMQSGPTSWPVPPPQDPHRASNPQRGGRRDRQPPLEDDSMRPDDPPPPPPPPPPPQDAHAEDPEMPLPSAWGPIAVLLMMLMVAFGVKLIEKAFPKQCAALRKGVLAASTSLKSHALDVSASIRRRFVVSCEAMDIEPDTHPVLSPPHLTTSPSPSASPPQCLVPPPPAPSSVSQCPIQPPPSTAQPPKPSSPVPQLEVRGVVDPPHTTTASPLLQRRVAFSVALAFGMALMLTERSEAVATLKRTEDEMFPPEVQGSGERTDNVMVASPRDEESVRDVGVGEVINKAESEDVGVEDVAEVESVVGVEDDVGVEDVRAENGIEVEGTTGVEVPESPREEVIQGVECEERGRELLCGHSEVNSEDSPPLAIAHSKGSDIAYYEPDFWWYGGDVMDVEEVGTELGETTPFGDEVIQGEECEERGREPPCGHSEVDSEDPPLDIAFPKGLDHIADESGSYWHGEVVDLGWSLGDVEEAGAEMELESPGDEVIQGEECEAGGREPPCGHSEVDSEDSPPLDIASPKGFDQIADDSNSYRYGGVVDSGWGLEKDVEEVELESESFQGMIVRGEECEVGGSGAPPFDFTQEKGLDCVVDDLVVDSWWYGEEVAEDCGWAPFCDLSDNEFGEVIAEGTHAEIVDAKHLKVSPEVTSPEELAAIADTGEQSLSAVEMSAFDECAPPMADLTSLHSFHPQFDNNDPFGDLDSISRELFDDRTPSLVIDTSSNTSRQFNDRSSEGSTTLESGQRFFLELDQRFFLELDQRFFPDAVPIFANEDAFIDVDRPDDSNTVVGKPVLGYPLDKKDMLFHDSDAKNANAKQEKPVSLPEIAQRRLNPSVAPFAPSPRLLFAIKRTPAFWAPPEPKAIPIVEPEDEPRRRRRNRTRPRRGRNGLAALEQSIMSAS